MMILVGAVCLLVGFLIGYFLTAVYTKTHFWLRSRKRFRCDACKAKYRLRDGFSPLALDLENGDEMVPLNLRLCRRCMPGA
jgi:hypothetical protein